MAWKIERWLAEVFPGKDEIYSAYRDLPRREMVIVGGAVLDVALAELLANRLRDIPNEYEQFLGLDEDGRAPCGSFGGRIQLALLLGIITEDDAGILRTVKNLRNKFAHRVEADFTSENVKPIVARLFQLYQSRVKGLMGGGVVLGSVDKLDEMKPYLEVLPDAGAGLFLAVFTLYQAYFHLLSGLVKRVDTVR